MGNTATYTVWGIDGGVHEASGVKPATTPAEQVALLREKGVTFERCGEDRALDVLANRETYLHLSAYRELFQRHGDGPDRGRFVRLDFGDLLDLCELDGEVRDAFRMMAGDVERAVKAQLVSEAASRGEDGYAIVADFAESLGEPFLGSLKRDLHRRIRGDVYSGALIAHYRDAMPAWVLLEVVPFGTLLAFYLFCMERWGEEGRREVHYALKDVKAIRNCASHGACLINGLAPGGETGHATSGVATDWLNSHGFKNNKGRRARLRNRRLQQLVTTVALHDMLAGGEAGGRTAAAMSALKSSLAECAGRYGSQNPFVSHLAFLAKVLDAAGA